MRVLFVILALSVIVLLAATLGIIRHIRRTTATTAPAVPEDATPLLRKPPTSATSASRNRAHAA